MTHHKAVEFFNSLWSFPLMYQSRIYRNSHFHLYIMHNLYIKKEKLYKLVSMTDTCSPNTH